MGLCTFSVFLNNLCFSEGVSYLTESGWKFLKVYQVKEIALTLRSMLCVCLAKCMTSLAAWFSLCILWFEIVNGFWERKKRANQWVDQLIHCSNKYFLYVLNFLHCAITECLSFNFMYRFIIFQQYRIPRESLLNRLADVTVDGDYETTFTTPAQQLGKSTQIVVLLHYFQTSNINLII